jgi:histidine triad (HIT) family protein
MSGSVCIFCDIASGSVAAEVVYETERTLAFLDHRPVFPGHTLLITREHYETLGDLPDHELVPFFSSARFLSTVIPVAMDAHGSFVAINNKVSQSVPHLHVHLVPRRRKDGLRGFFWPRHPYRSEQEMKRAADAIRTEIVRRGEPR